MLPRERPAAARPPVPHLGYIDGLRALAALSVLVYHAYDRWTNTGRIDGRIPWTDRALLMGAHGVDLFFVISGFCLAYPTLARVRNGTATTFDTASYFARRLVRIVPPYYAAILVFVVVFSALHLRSPGLAPLALVQQVLFLDRDQSYLASPFWTLAVELRWYAAFPALLGLYVRLPRVFALLGIAAYVCYYFTRLNPPDVGTLPAFMLGIWAADLEVTQSRLRRYAAPVGIPCAVLSLSLVSGAQFYAVQPVGVVAACTFVVAAGSLEWLRRLLSLRALTVFGVASYSIYLIHEPVIEYCETFSHAPALLAALVALALSMAFYVLFEKPWLGMRLRIPVTAWVQARIVRFVAFLSAEPRTPIKQILDDACMPGVAEGKTLASRGP